ncbi:hypothetical protein [Crateriforma spongiae]|uniref:hypothetical protein n=1 Tax=Crateriforma spongiae TaxID=2724528 RepID=UPI0039B0DFD5
MMESLLEEDLTASVVFRRRPIDIPGDMRPAWRIAFIVMMLKLCCRGGKSSIRRLHVLNWCGRSAEAGNLLRRAVSERLSPGAVLVRIEPSLARAVDFALGAKLLDRDGKDRVKLTKGGHELADEVLADSEVLVREKEWAAALGQTVTEGFVDNIFSGRGGS